MSAPHLARAATSNAASHVADRLASAYLTLHTAAAAAGDLVSANPSYLGTAGWDVEINIHAATTAIENAVGVHDLASFHPFWSSGTLRSTIVSTHTRVHKTAKPGRTDALIAQLSCALTDLATANEQAEHLVDSDHNYANHHGYIGGLGWDLQTALDDALTAVRTAISATALAETNSRENLQ